MSKLRAMVLFAIVAALAGSAFAADTAFIQANGTTDQVALFAAYVVNVPAIGASDPIRTAFSISNLMSAPPGLMDFEGMTTEEGAIHFYLFRYDGEMFTVSTSDLDDPETLGNGQLNDDGELDAGETWGFYLNELFDAAGGGDDIFTGYVWIVCDFDAAAGTYSTFDPGLGFAQSFKLDPAMGVLGWMWGGFPAELE